jgi:hypothetical protein
LIDKCADEAEVKIQTDLSEALDEKFQMVMSKFLSIQTTITPAVVPAPPTPTSVHGPSMLPKPTLPSFSGSYQDWQSFSDMFIATFHTNTSLKGVQKLQYLKGCVTGDAAILVNNFPVTEASYNEAWNVLQDRYENEREIVNFLFVLGLMNCFQTHEATCYVP